MDVLCPPFSHDVPLQDKVRVACNEGARNSRDARLVSLSNDLNIRINNAIYVVWVKTLFTRIKLDTTWAPATAHKVVNIE
jgi:hypothetical protein